MNRNVIKGNDIYNGDGNSNNNNGIVIHSCPSNIGHNSDDIDREKSEYRDILGTIRLPPTINVNIFRYKFTDEFMEDLFKFSKIHQYDHRSVFKEAWIIWTQEKKN